jgi:hypothetical protein
MNADEQVARPAAERDSHAHLRTFVFICVRCLESSGTPNCPHAAIVSPARNVETTLAACREQ